MYGLKIHKKDVPLRHILLMTDSAQHQLALWLTSVIDPFLSLYSTHCISDSFTFANKVEIFLTFLHLSFSAFMTSATFSLTFRLQKSLKSALMLWYNGELTPSSFPRSIFVELTQTTTSSDEFSSNNTMHRQIYGVAMGSPLNTSVANIFVCYYETLLFKRVNKPLMYYRYIYDTFAAFNDENECNEFFFHLNSLHPLLRFTFEKICNRTLFFLDVLMKKNNRKIVTSIYRKPTSTGQYIRWNSFCPIKRNTCPLSSGHMFLIYSSK